MNELGYAGDLSPKDCWDFLKNDKNSFLIDCRTQIEWQFIGMPDLTSIGKKLVLIEWQIYPTMNLNLNFLDEIKKLDLNKKDKIIFICRSGGRSQSAAKYIASQGFENCYNCISGFEGPHNSLGHRGKKEGWKFCNLPWKQS